jgi:hypothetical protein
MKILLFLLSFILIGLSGCSNKGFSKVFDDQEEEYISNDNEILKAQSSVVDMYSFSLLPIDYGAPPKARAMYIFNELEHNGKSNDPYRRARDGLIRCQDDTIRNK